MKIKSKKQAKELLEDYISNNVGDSEALRDLYACVNKLYYKKYHTKKGYLPYNLKKDHTEIKKHIKEWEVKLNEIVWTYLFSDKPIESTNVLEELEEISHEMCSINI